MKLKKIEITYFRCFERLTVPLQDDINVFVGINGSGKTTILDAIAIALYNIVAANGGGGNRHRSEQGVTLRPGDIHLKQGEDAVPKLRDFVQISAQADNYYELPNFSGTTVSGEPRVIDWTNYIQFRPPKDFTYGTNKSKQLNDIYRYFEDLWQEVRRSDSKALIPFPVVGYYRASRRFSQMPKMSDIFSFPLERDGAFQDALNAGANYQAMCQWFYLRENQELRHQKRHSQNDINFEFSDLKAMRGAIKKVLGNVNNIFFDDNPPRLKVELIVEETRMQILELDQLSDGYRNLIAMILDFARRLAQAHPFWDNPLDAPGVMLIDEIELHLHPQWQQRIIPNLRSIFPNTQLIVSTHSPQVLTTVEREKVFILKSDKLYAASTSTYGAESNRLMREVMETENRPPDNEFSEYLQQLFKLISEDELEAALSMSERLIRYRPDEPVLIEAQTIIKNRQWEKEIGL